MQTSMNVLKACQTARVKLHASTRVVVTTVIAQLDIMEMEHRMESAVLVNIKHIAAIGNA